MICELCQKECKTYGSLHSHLTKEHKTSQAEYYYFFYPRYDLFDGEKIIYKDRESYFKTDFNFKSNLFDWLKTAPNAKEYALKILTDRAERKQDWRLLTQTELKTLFSPSLLGFEKIFGSLENFYSVANAAGLKGLGCETPVFKDGDIKIFQDTREHYPHTFDCQVEVQKLACGDYRPSNEFFCDLFVERKSLCDLAGTLTSGIDRFKREIERAKELGFYLVVLTECKLSDVEEYSSSNSFARKVNGSHLLKQIRDLTSENVQFVFSSLRQRSSQIVERIFRMGEQAKRVDLELLKDKGEL